MIFAGPRALAAKLAAALRTGVHFLFGTGSRTAATLAVTALFIGFWLGTRQTDIAGVEDRDFIAALSIASHFEKSGRDLGSRLETEHKLRTAAERTISALSETVREQDGQILNLQEQLNFLHQLVAERSGQVNEINIRGFEIYPDFRESSYRLAAVLVRSGGRKEGKLFKGSFKLVLSLSDGTGDTQDYRPLFENTMLDVEFQYYNEIDIGFTIPAGAEILNAQITVLDEDGSKTSSRVLHDLL